MRKYVDCIRVTDVNLAYTIVEALEKDDNYSVDFYDQSSSTRRADDGRREIELRVYHNQKVTPIPPIGFSDAKTEEEESE